MSVTHKMLPSTCALLAKVPTGSYRSGGPNLSDSERNMYSRQLGLKSSRSCTSSLPAMTRILFITLIIPMAQICQSTSNINSVWLAKDDQDQADKTPGALDFERRAGHWNPNESHTSGPMQASSSSLQPSIVSIDQDHIQTPQASKSRRRILTDIPENLKQNLLSGNLNHSSFTDEATSLDHLWSGNQTNDQVQFDEEHHHSPSNGNNHRLDHVILEGHQDSNETSTLSPQHESPMSRKENHQKPDLSGRRTRPRANSSQKYETHATQDEYNNEGYKINNYPFTNQIQAFNNNESKSTASGIKDRHSFDHIHQLEQRLGNPIDSWNSSSSHQPSDDINDLYLEHTAHLANDNISGHSKQHLGVELASRSTLGLVGPDTQDESSGTTRSTPSGLPRHESLSYGFVPQTTQSIERRLKGYQVTPSPLYLIPDQPNSYLSENTETLNAGSQSHRVTPRIVQHPPRSIQYKVHSQQTNNEIFRRALDQNHTNTKRLASRFIYSPSAELQVSGHRSSNSLLGSYSPIMNYMKAPKVRKSLLGTLGTKLNGLNDQLLPFITSRYPNLESSFFEGQSLTNGIQANRNLAAGLVVRNPNLNYLTASRSSLNNRQISLPVRQLSTSYISKSHPNEPFLRQTNYIHSLHKVEQPIVAPVTSSLSNFYGSYTPTLRRRRVPVTQRYVETHQAQGSRQLTDVFDNIGTQVIKSQSTNKNFIPVVSLEITKTSPAPKQTDPEIQGETNAQDTSDEIENYLKSKIGQKKIGDKRMSSTSSKNNDNGQTIVFDDYGNLAAGSSRGESPVRLYSNRNSAQHHSSDPHDHITTVKSTIFGYLPQQAEVPLVQAMSVIPQLQSSGSGPFSSHGNHLPSASDVYTNHLNQQEVAPEGNLQTQPVEQTYAGILPVASNDMVVEEPPSLSLQLQANNFAQNDIAHPFRSPQSHQYIGNVRPIDLMTANQISQQYQDLNLLPQGIQNQQYHSNVVLNPLLTEENSMKTAQPYASASELNPMVPQLIFASPANFMRATEQQHQAQASNQESDFSSNDSNQKLSYTRPLTSSGSALNNKGNKKRSSEFFASAGQILLSALPLLLAPTLGLMFASSPIPATKYHGQNPLGSGSINTGAIPGTYINSLNGGVVSNASPTPQIFTPTPPGYNITTTIRPSTATLSSRKKPPTTTLSPSFQKKNLNSNSASSTSTSKRPLGVLLSTLTQPPFSNKTEYHIDIEPSNSSNGSISSLDSRQTFLLLSHEDPEPSEDRSNATTPSSLLEKPNLDLGYEGVDFDAQFASLRRSTNAKVIETPRNTKPLKNKNRYHYSEVSIDTESNDAKVPSSSTVETRKKVQNFARTRLYPVTTWPPNRRRTVSVVTSSGNRTLDDATDKYKTIFEEQKTPLNTSTLVRFDDDFQSVDGFNSSITPNLYPIATATNSGLVQLIRRARDIGSDIPIKKSNTLKRIKGKLDQDPLKHKNSSLRLESVDLLPASSRSTNSSTNQKELMSEDSSKSKTSHIISASITHSDDNDEINNNDYEHENKTTPANIHSFEHDPEDYPQVDLPNIDDFNSSVSQKFRDQLLKKKMLLERIADDGPIADPKTHLLSASRRHQYSTSQGYLEPGNDEHMGNNRRSHHLSHDSGSETIGEQIDFSLGGRGRFPVSPVAPIEVISTKIRVFPNRTERTVKNSGRSKVADGKLVLTDDTKKALANFGNLLLKDTLQIPVGTLRGRHERSHRQIVAGPNYFERNRNLQHNHLDDDSFRHPTSLDHQQVKSGYDSATATEHSLYLATPRPENNDNVEELKVHRRRLPSESNHINRTSSDEWPRKFNSSWATDRQFEGPLRDRVNLIDNPESSPNRGSLDDRTSDDYVQDTGRYINSAVYSPHSLQRTSDNYKSEVLRYPNHQSNFTKVENYTDSIQSNHRVDTMTTAPSTDYNDNYGNYFNNYYTGPDRHRDKEQGRYLETNSRSYYPTRDRQPPFNYNQQYPESSYPPHSSSYQNSGTNQGFPQYNQYQNYNRDYNIGPSGYSRPDRPPYNPPPPPTYAPEPSQSRYSNPDPHYREHEPPSDNNRGNPRPESPFGLNSHNQNTGYGFKDHHMNQNYDFSQQPYSSSPSEPTGWNLLNPLSSLSQSNDRSEAKTVNEYLKRVQFSDTDRDKLMASYLTCDGLLNDNDHCLERLSCEFSDPVNIEKANKLDRAVSSILLGHILINNYIPNQFKHRLKSASLFGYTQSGRCSRYICHKLQKSVAGNES